MYASEGHYSAEIDLLAKIDRFGVEAVLGKKVLYFGELRKMIYAENLVTAYRSRTQSQNWASWVNEHPVWADMLADAERLCPS
jgi:hypothetical protein